MLILHDILVSFLNVYMYHKRNKKITDRAIIIQKNIAIPLYLSSKELVTKLGMNSTLAYNLKPINNKYLSK